MKVYQVIQRASNYEGDILDNIIGVFETKDEAQKYLEKLKKASEYDFYDDAIVDEQLVLVEVTTPWVAFSEDELDEYIEDNQEEESEEE